MINLRCQEMKENSDRGHPVVLLLTVILHIVQLSNTTYKVY